MNILEEENMERKEKLEKEKEITRKNIEPEINLAKKKIENIKTNIQDYEKTLNDQKKCQQEFQNKTGIVSNIAKQKKN